VPPPAGVAPEIADVEKSDIREIKEEMGELQAA
jgi:hypothetical protein